MDDNPIEIGVNYMLIELWDWYFEQILMLIPHHTGIIWTNQVGGTACLHPQMEGFCYPLSVSVERDPLEDYSGPDYDPDLVQKFLDMNNLGERFRPLSQEEDKSVRLESYAAPEHPLDYYLAEAWIPVVALPVKDFSLDRCAMNALTGHLVILTYPNSD